MCEIEDRVAEALTSSEADEIITDLRKLVEFTEATLKNVADGHAKLVDLINRRIKRKEKVFCSKYASFHLPEIVPILDSRSEKEAKRLVKELERNGDYVESDDSQQNNKDPDRYKKHCANLLRLMNELRKHGVAKPSLKKLDHVLYWRRGQMTTSGYRPAK